MPLLKKCVVLPIGFYYKICLLFDCHSHQGNCFRADRVVYSELDEMALIAVLNAQIFVTVWKVNRLF